MCIHGASTWKFVTSRKTGGVEVSSGSYATLHVYAGRPDNRPMDADQALLRLLKKHRIAEQAELLALLRREGIDFTQSTLSRHFRRLSVVKLDGRYQQVGVSAAAAPVVSLEAAPPNLLVAKTGPGLASVLAIQLDQGDIEGVVGTVAGDDTILIVVRGPEMLAETRARVEAFLAQHG